MQQFFKTLPIVFVGFFLLASAIVANKMLLVSLSPTLLVGLRMFFGGGVLLLLSLRSKRRTPLKTIVQDWGMILGIALLTTFIPSLAKAYALKHMLSSKASFIGALDPFMTALYAWFLFQERLSWRKIVGIFLGFFGAILMCFVQSPGMSYKMVDFLFFSLPELAALTAVATSRLGWLLVQRYLKKERYQPVQLNGLIMIVSGFIALPIASMTEPVNILALLSSSKITSLLLYTTIVGNVLAYTMVAYFLKWYSSSFVSLAGFSVPIFVTLCGWLVLSEPISGMLLVAAAVIFIAVYFFYKEENPFKGF